jgi:uncharacterized protein (DUF2062 family)
MARKLIKKYLPHPRTITDNRWIKFLGPRLKEPGLWHVNRKSFSGGVAVGVFCAFMPIPFQMLLAAIAAILFRVNILVAVPLVRISNPVTIAPIFYFCYLVGTKILGEEVNEFLFELSVNWLLAELGDIWQPMLLGCLVVGSLASIAALLLSQFLWRYHIWTRIKIRRNRRTRAKSDSA